MAMTMTGSRGGRGTGSETRLDLVATRRVTVADGVVLIELADPAGADLPAWEPGAHIDVITDGGLIRQFSLCGDVGQRGTWRIAVLREVAGRGGSAYLHDGVAEGSVVAVRGPRNHFALEPAGAYLFIAGGIGITPILPMIAAADAAGSAWTLTYGGRSRPSMAFADELRSRYGDRVQIRPQDETGLLDLAALLAEPRPDTLVYCCGPEPLLGAVESACLTWPPGALHVERFAPRPQPAAGAPRAFEVELARSGLTLTVPPGASILRVVEAAGVDVLSSCTEGTCGTCETAVLDGVPEHRDSLLTAAERAAGDTMMICVSRSATPKLVLDL